MISSVQLFTENIEIVDGMNIPSSDIIINDTYYIQSGDTEVWENQSIFLDALLVILGKLVLRNTTVTVNSSYQIYTEGIVEITDLDNDPTTTEDRSEIIGNGTWRTLLSTGTTGNISITNSYGSNLSLEGDLLILDSDLLEDTRVILNDDSHLANSTFRSSNMDPNHAVTTVSTSMINLENLTVIDHKNGIMNQEGALNINNCHLINCSSGITTNIATRTYIRSSSIIGSEVPIDSLGLIDIKDSKVVNGSINMREKSLVSFNTVFTEIDGIDMIQVGWVVNSTFIDCIAGLISPKSVTVTRSRFIECGVAISEPEDCLIYHNAFILNFRETEGIPDSMWYDSDLKEGNYYTSYRGKDDGSGDRIREDGIGDTDLPHNGRDLYPLMKDLYWEMPYIPDFTAYHFSGTGRINITWTTNDIDGVLIQRSTQKDFSKDLTIWSVSGDSITIENNPNSTLYFRITGYNSRGYRGWSHDLRINVDQAPLPPKNIVVESLNEGSSLKVSWDFVGEDINRTIIKYSSPAGPSPNEYVTYPKNEVILSDLENGVAYNISILTEDHNGQISSLAPNVTGTPFDLVPPPPPRSLYAQPLTNTSVEIFWDPPFIQDISAYLVYRKGPNENGFKLVGNLSQTAIHFVDRGLKDNTTYEYGVSAVDDDGPISEMAGPIKVTTKHINRPPEFFGGIDLIYLIEDNGSFSMDLDKIAYDPDGDPLIISVEDYYPFLAEISDDLLNILPQQDQSGEGFVKVKVSDGEVSSFLIMGIIIQSIPDPPTGVTILSPVNGSVILPGRSVLLLADAFDPDTQYGDNLTYRWTSDIDGALNGPGSIKEHLYTTLSPGIHNITLDVTDSTGNTAQRKVRVLVSLWGWGEFPWSARILSSEATEEGGQFTVRIRNDGPIQLTFIVSANDISTSQIVGERGILVGPSSTGDLFMDIVGPFKEGSVLELELKVNGETLNGTYAGELEINESLEVKGNNERRPPETFLLVILLGFSLIAIVILIVVFIIGKGVFLKAYKDNLDEDVPVPDSNGAGNNGR